jgi:hypothetical protein
MKNNVLKQKNIVTMGTYLFDESLVDLLEI